tara:strand:- start:4361 stop:5203 length:843 start_codon:yes stop_codon:yes gene_type:complete
MSPYLKLIRFDKPVGTLLLLWPALWALLIASSGVINIHILLVFCFGVFLTRSAGCAINDYFDKDFDRLVDRTKDRPLAQKEIPAKHAIYLAGILFLLAFGLVLSLGNTDLIFHSFIALLLACIYPLLKRYTFLPQMGLGLAFSYSIPMAFVAEIGFVPSIAWVLYIISVTWTLMYDTVYAMADMDDDIEIGIKSSALLFGDYIFYTIGVLQLLVIIGFIYLGYRLDFNIYYYFSIMLAALCFLYQTKLIAQYKYIKAFKNNNIVGFLILLGMYSNSYLIF